MNCLGRNICDETESYLDQEAVIRDNFYGKVVRESEKCVILIYIETPWGSQQLT